MAIATAMWAFGHESQKPQHGGTEPRRKEREGQKQNMITVDTIYPINIF